MPTSQKNRPVSFALLVGSAPREVVTLYLRPEELTRSEPARITTHNTLGGAYADEFGIGLPDISISGVTGWRGNSDGDGEAQFRRLQGLFASWYAERAQLVARHQDPSSVELALVDALDEINDIVVPIEFQLERRKQRPLLIQYRIRLTAMGAVGAAPAGSADSIMGAISGLSGRVKSAVDSLGGVIDQRGQLAKAIGGFGDTVGDLADAGEEFLDKTQGVLDAVTEGVDKVTGIIDDTIRPVYELSVAIEQAGRNVFSAIDTVLRFPQNVAAEIGAVAQNFQSAYCTLRNTFDLDRYAFDISPLFGASNCSSTGGGRAASSLLSENPFERLSGGVSPSVVSTQSARAIQVARGIDPVSAALPPSVAAGLLRDMASGISL